MAQGYKDRMDESMAMRKRSYGASFDLKDGSHDGEVKMIQTNAEGYDRKRVKPYSDGSKGYPSQAWNYDY